MEVAALGFGTTVVLVLLALFILYKTGIMDLTQKSMERASAMADRKLEAMDFESQENHSKTLGKVKKKLGNTSISRSSAKDLNRLFKALEDVKIEEDGKGI